MSDCCCIVIIISFSNYVSDSDGGYDVQLHVQYNNNNNDDDESVCMLTCC